MTAERAGAAIALADWLESTRASDGYGGPVAHWWRDCLVDCRAGHDWRYEGIIAGYLDLHGASGQAEWLERAGRAGDDLLAAQGVDGHFTRSRFELNPGTGGTPHEAAAATGLIRLARALRPDQPAAADRYLEAARRTVDRAHVERLWDAEAEAFRDEPRRRSFVPNKACTLIEALVELAEATGHDRYLHGLAEPTGRAVLAHQVRRPGHRLDGAIAQNSFDGRVVPKYFPYYVARCVPALLALHEATGHDRFADAALAAGRFVLRCREPDGGYPQVLYEDGRVSRFPRWVAATGDVLRALRALRPLGLDDDPAATEAWLAAGMLPNGGVMTARGFAAQATSRPPGGRPELRDLLSVAGWADKAFRYLAAEVDGAALRAAAAPGRAVGVHEAECTFLGRPLELRADARGLEVRHRGRVAYRWEAGAPWAQPIAPWMAAR